MNTNLKSVYIADAYFRLSKEDGDKAESDSIVNQKALVQEFLKANPDIKIYKERVDDGYTGVNFERPAFKEVMEDIKAGRINCVVVKDLSRFGRNYIEAGRYIEKIFPYLGVRFIAINDNIDTASATDSSSEMLIPFKNLINDAYCRDISIKVRSHLDIKRKSGQYIGSFAPYGYKKSPNNKNQLIVDEKAAAVVRQIFKWKIEGMSGARIAEKLNELGVPTPMEYKHNNGENFQCGFRRKAVPQWQANGVNYILRNEIYTGVLLQGKTSSPNYKIRKRTKKEKKDWIRCEDSHEPIISKKEFNMVNTSFECDTRVAPDSQTLYLFSGFTKCGYCGGNMTRKTIPAPNGRKYVYLICTENKNKNGCTNSKGISLEKFETVILEVINHQIDKVVELSRMIKLVEDIPYNGYFTEKLRESIADKERDIEKKKHYLSDIYQDYKDGILSREEYLDLKESFRTKIDSLNLELQALWDEYEGTAEVQSSKADWVKQFIEYKGFKELSRELLLRLVEQIKVYDKDRIEVIFKFQSEYEQAVKYIAAVTQSDSDSLGVSDFHGKKK